VATSLMFWTIWIFWIVFFVVIASAVGDASLDSVGDVRIEPCFMKLRIFVSNLPVRQAQYEGITLSMIFDIIVFDCSVKQKWKLTLCFLKSSRTKVYSQFGMGMINPEVIIAPFVVFKS